MLGDHVSHVMDPGPIKSSPALRYALLALGGAGLVAFLIGAFTGDAASRQEAWAGYMVSMLFFWFLALGAAAFLAIQYVTSAKWFVTIKRVPEALASFVYRGGFVLPLFALLGTAYIYPWAESANYQEIWGAAAPSYPYEGTAKDAWLTVGMHWVRTLVYIVPVVLLTYLLVKHSLARSEDAPEAASRRRLKTAIFFLIVFAPLFSLYSWEMVMSVEPKWFSTMFGVYCFAGALLSALTVMMMLMFVMKDRTQYLHERQMYDMGTYIMAFATFMVYIGFSQFMLIWYANLYDETFFYLDRYQGGWWIVTAALPVLKWVIPFFVLMPPPLRTNRYAQGVCCVAILFGQVLDIYWIIYPAYYGEVHLPSLINILTFLGMSGFFGWSVLSFLAQRSMLPVGDADLLSSVNGDYLHA